MISHNKIIGSLVYRTMEAMNNNQHFIDGIDLYPYAANCFTGDHFNFWHYAGPHNEISSILTLSGEHLNGGKVKFPSVLNFQTVRQSIDGIDREISYNLSFIARTEPNWTTGEREKYVFDPLLRPLVDEFIYQVNNYPYFRSGYGIGFDYYEVFTYGKNQGVLTDAYGDYIDAIEIQNMKVAIDQLCNSDIDIINNEYAIVNQKIIETLKSK